MYIIGYILLAVIIVLAVIYCKNKRLLKSGDIVIIKKMQKRNKFKSRKTVIKPEEVKNERENIAKNNTWVTFWLMTIMLIDILIYMIIYIFSFVI